MNVMNILSPPVKCIFNPRLSFFVQFVVAITVNALIEGQDNVVIKFDEIESLIVKLPFCCRAQSPSRLV